MFLRSRVRGALKTVRRGEVNDRSVSGEGLRAEDVIDYGSCEPVYRVTFVPFPEYRPRIAQKAETSKWRSANRLVADIDAWASV